MWEPDAILLQTILLHLSPLLIMLNLKTFANTYVGIWMKIQTNFRFYIIFAFIIFFEVILLSTLVEWWQALYEYRGIGICIF